jgi:hypothetical protein
MKRRSTLRRSPKSRLTSLSYRQPWFEPLEERQVLSVVTWTVDQAQSSATVTLPDQELTLEGITATIKIRDNDNSAWNGNVAAIAGTFTTNYTDGSSIEFLSGMDTLVGVNSGSYIPDPANWDSINQVFTSNAAGPGVYGGKIRATAFVIVTEDVGWFNFTDLAYEVASGPLTITGTSFATNTTTVGIDSVLVNALGDEDVLGQGQLLPDTQVLLEDAVTTNAGANGSIINTGGLNRKLTFPISIPIAVEIPQDPNPPVVITGSITGQIVANATLPNLTATVTGRRLFYNNSVWDDPGFGFTNASAIAGDKTAYIPNGSNTSTFASMSSYDKGINGIMVEVTGATNTLTAADFTIKMSGQGFAANNTPSTWAAAPSFSVTRVPNTPSAGTDRYELVWADGAITERYLYVVVEGNDALGGNNTNTQLAASDYFFFGSKIGDVGTPEFYPNVDATDQVQVRNNQGSTAPPTGVLNIFDFNRDALIDATDQIVARNNQGAMPWLNLSAPPAAPEGGGGGNAVASALAGAGGGSDEGSAVAAALLLDDADDAAAPAPSAAAIADAGSPQVADGGDAADAVDEALDDELLDSLLD